MPNQLLRRFDAASYQGRTVRVSGEARRLNLFGFAFPLVQAISTSGKTTLVASGPAISAQAGDAWIPFVLKLLCRPMPNTLRPESKALGSVPPKCAM